MKAIASSLVLVPALLLTGCPERACDPGEMCTWFGTGERGISDAGIHRRDAKTFWVVDVAFGPDDLGYVLDWNNHRIVRVNADDELELISGVGGELGDGPEGPAASAQWNHPTDLDWQSDGTLILAAWHNSRLAAFDPTLSTMEFIAGTGARDFGGDGGPAVDALLDLPCGVVVDDQDNIYLADMANQRIRVIGTDGIIDTVAGTGAHGFNGDGPALETMLASPALQRAEPAFKMEEQDGVIYFADTHNGRVRAFDVEAGTITTVAGMGETPPDSSNGTACTSGCGYGGDGGPATEAMLDYPADVAVGADGTLYIADSDNHCIRAVDPDDGTISTFAGICGQQTSIEDSPDGALATEAGLNSPFGVEVGPDGAVYISDTYNSVIRRVEPL